MFASRFCLLAALSVLFLLAAAPPVVAQNTGVAGDRAAPGEFSVVPQVPGGVRHGDVNHVCMDVSHYRPPPPGPRCVPKTAVTECPPGHCKDMIAGVCKPYSECGGDPSACPNPPACVAPAVLNLTSCSCQCPVGMNPTAAHGCTCANPNLQLVGSVCQCPTAGDVVDANGDCCAAANLLSNVCQACPLGETEDSNGDCCHPDFQVNGECQNCTTPGHMEDQHGTCCGPSHYDPAPADLCQVCPLGEQPDGRGDCCAAADQVHGWCPCADPLDVPDLNGDCCPLGDQVNDICVSCQCQSGETCDLLGDCCDPAWQVAGICGPCPPGETEDLAGECCDPATMQSGLCPTCVPPDVVDYHGACCPLSEQVGGVCLNCGDCEHVVGGACQSYCVGTDVCAVDGTTCVPPPSCPVPGDAFDSNGDCCPLSEQVGGVCLVCTGQLEPISGSCQCPGGGTAYGANGDLCCPAVGHTVVNGVCRQDHPHQCSCTGGIGYQWPGGPGSRTQGLAAGDIVCGPHGTFENPYCNSGLGVDYVVDGGPRDGNYVSVCEDDEEMLVSGQCAPPCPAMPLGFYWRTGVGASAWVPIHGGSNVPWEFCGYPTALPAMSDGDSLPLTSTFVPCADPSCQPRTGSVTLECSGGVHQIVGATCASPPGPGCPPHGYRELTLGWCVRTTP